MSLMRKTLLLAAFLFPTVGSAAETIAQPVKVFRYNAEANYLYVVGANGWGSADCVNATYVQVKSTVAGHKQMFAAVLAAHSNGKTVKFWGTCNTDPNYFDATYIIVE